jgi:hypothetical protein
MSHIHDWKPVQGRMAQYACECGGSAYRNRFGKFIIRAGTPAAPVEPTAQAKSYTGRPGLIPKEPDDYDC